MRRIEVQKYIYHGDEQSIAQNVHFVEIIDQINGYNCRFNYLLLSKILIYCLDTLIEGIVRYFSHFNSVNRYITLIRHKQWINYLLPL